MVDVEVPVPELALVLLVELAAVEAVDVVEPAEPLVEPEVDAEDEPDAAPLPDVEDVDEVDAVELEFDVALVLVAVPVLVVPVVLDAVPDEVFVAEPPSVLDALEDEPVDAVEPEFDAVPVVPVPGVVLDEEPEVVPVPDEEPDADEPVPDVVTVEVVFVEDDEVDPVVEEPVVEPLPEPVLEPELALELELELLELELELAVALVPDACAVFTEGMYAVGKRELEMMIPKSTTLTNPDAAAFAGLKRFRIV